MDPKLQEVMDTVLEDFDFESVHALMVINKWTYLGEKKAPTVERLKDNVVSMFHTLDRSDRPNTKIGSGGFQLCRWTWDSGVEIELLFKWKSWSHTF